MSSIVTEELFNEDETTCDVISVLVKTLEERTCLRQRRHTAVKVKLQEMTDRKNKLDKQRLDRLASQGIYVDLDEIKDNIRKTLAANKESKENETETMEDNSIQMNECSVDDQNEPEIEKEQNEHVIEIEQNEPVLNKEQIKKMEEQKRLNDALRDLQKHNLQKQAPGVKKSNAVSKSNNKNKTSVGKRNPQRKDIDTKPSPVQGKRRGSIEGNSSSPQVKRRGSIGGNTTPLQGKRKGSLGGNATPL